MSRPGVEFLSRDTAPPRSAPTDTGVWFVTGLTDKGEPSDSQVPITSLTKFEHVFGDRVSYSVLYDSLDYAFGKGVSTAYVSRVLGPTPVNAFAYAYDIAGSTVPDASLIITAKSAGSWGNSLNYEIVNTAGTSYVAIFSHDTDGELERTASFTTRAEAVAWSEFSDYVDITLGTSAELPRTAAATGLTTGADDQASITETEWTAALAQFLATMGPGQVSAPGRTTTAAYTALLDHAEQRNRIALLDGADVTSTGEATLTAAAGAQQSLADARYGGLFAPWMKIGGLVANTTRSIPPSAVAAGLIAANDSVNDPGQAAAGINGVATGVIDLNATFSDSDYEDLNEAGVNMFRVLAQYDGEVRLYGYRTLVDKSDFPNHWQLSDMRLYMAIRARGQDIAEHYLFGQIDGRGQLLAAYAGELSGMLLGYYEANALYGNTPGEAFAVDVGADVNPIEDLADGIIRAVISLRMSPFAELVKIEIVKRSIVEVLV